MKSKADRLRLIAAKVESAGKDPDKAANTVIGMASASAYSAGKLAKKLEKLKKKMVRNVAAKNYDDAYDDAIEIQEALDAVGVLMKNVKIVDSVIKNWE